MIASFVWNFKQFLREGMFNLSCKQLQHNGFPVCLNTSKMSENANAFNAVDKY